MFETATSTSRHRSGSLHASGQRGASHPGWEAPAHDWTFDSCCPTWLSYVSIDHPLPALHCVGRRARSLPAGRCRTAPGSKARPARGPRDNGFPLFAQATRDAASLGWWPGPGRPSQGGQGPRQDCALGGRPPGPGRLRQGVRPPRRSLVGCVARSLTWGPGRTLAIVLGRWSRQGPGVLRQGCSPHPDEACWPVRRATGPSPWAALAVHDRQDSGSSTSPPCSLASSPSSSRVSSAPSARSNPSRWHVAGAVVPRSHCEIEDCRTAQRAGWVFLCQPRSQARLPDRRAQLHPPCAHHPRHRRPRAGRVACSIRVSAQGRRLASSGGSTPSLQLARSSTSSTSAVALTAKPISYGSGWRSAAISLTACSSSTRPLNARSLIATSTPSNRVTRLPGHAMDSPHAAGAVATHPGPPSRALRPRCAPR